jgi:hypothetical protein
LQMNPRRTEYIERMLAFPLALIMYAIIVVGARFRLILATIVIGVVLATSAFASNWAGYAVTLTPGAIPSPTPSPTPTPVTGVIRADQFISSMGVGTKLGQGDSETGAIHGFQYLGSGHAMLARDDAMHCQTGTLDANGMPTNSCGYGGGYEQELCDVHVATGSKYTEIPIVDSEQYGGAPGVAIADTKTQWDFLHACGAMAFGEGPNEPNNFGFNYKGVRCDLSGNSVPCVGYQADLYAMFKADSAFAGMQMAGMTDVGAEATNNSLQNLTVPTGTFAAGTPPAGTGLADVANAHNYFQGNGPSACTPIDNQIFWAESINRGGTYAGLFDTWGEYWGTTWGHGYPAVAQQQNDVPKMTTETGWNTFKCTPGIADALKAHMLTDLWFQAARMGWQSTIVYQMNNDRPSDGGYGFFSNTGASPIADATNALPMGVYTHNITTILADTSSAFTPTSVPYSMTGQTCNSDASCNAYSLLIQKSTGVHELVVWGEAFQSQASTPVTVNLGASHSVVKVYDVTAGTAPVTTLSNVSSVPLTVSDHAFIIEF